MESMKERLRKDIRKCVKDRHVLGGDVCKYLLGELQRSPKKDLTIEEEIRILKGVEKKEEDLLDKIGKDEPSEFLTILRTYLPTMASPVEIEAWIRSNNIDFASLKNPMQAVGIVMKEFGPRADGRIVKDIVKKVVEERNS